jgi:hypothetical protein
MFRKLVRRAIGIWSIHDDQSALAYNGYGLYCARHRSNRWACSFGGVTREVRPSAEEKETFLIPAGKMIVDYVATGHVCRIGLPPVAPDNRQPGMKSAKAMDNFLLELIPPAQRGKN